VEAAGFRLMRSSKMDTGSPDGGEPHELASQSDGLGFRVVVWVPDTVVTAGFCE
jgi:hypothetical protein